MSEATQGHNGQLRSIVERIERLDEEISGLRSDQRDIYAEAKSGGFDLPALKAIVRARREDPEKRRAREAMIEVYRGELGLK